MSILILVIGSALALIWWRSGHGGDREIVDDVAARHGIINYYIGSDGLRHDKMELSNNFKKIKPQVDLMIEEEMSHAIDQDRHPGATKDFLRKKILKERFSLDWRTLREMNPEVQID